MAPTLTAKLQYLNDGGAGPGTPDLFQLLNPGGGLAYSISSGGGEQAPQAAIAASGAINPHFADDYVITKAGVAAMTLLAPTVTLEDGLMIVLQSATAFAHTLTTVGLLQTGTASVNSITFPAFAGAGVELVAYQGKWLMTTLGASSAVYVLA